MLITAWNKFIDGCSVNQHFLAHWLLEFHYQSDNVISYSGISFMYLEVCRRSLGENILINRKKLEKNKLLLFLTTV